MNVQPFPPGRRHEDLLEFFLSETSLHTLDTPFELPPNDGSFSSISTFVDQELKLQSEIVREELSRKVHRVARLPDTERREKHLSFSLPHHYGEITVATHAVNCFPPRSKFTNYFVVLQTEERGLMQNRTLACCTQYRKKDGVKFRLGRDAASNLSKLRSGELIYVRPLMNYSMLKIHIQALVELRKRRMFWRLRF